MAKKMNELLEIESTELENRGIVNESPFHDLPQYLNLEKIIRSDIPEFKNASESIIKKFFEKAIQIHEITLIDAEEGENELNDWDLSEGLGSKGFFGNAEISGKGKALGIYKKKMLVEGIGKTLKKVFEKAKIGDFNAARLFNFFPNTVELVGLDNYSDILIKVLSDEFESYTKRIIKETNISSKFISKETGLLIVYDVINGKVMKKEEYFYPEEFLSNIPVVDGRDFNAMASMRREINNSSKALKNIFTEHKNKKLKEVEELESHDFDIIREMIDYRFFASFFAGTYKTQKCEIIEAYKVLPRLRGNDPLETIRNILQKLDDIKIYYTEEQGVIKIKEDHVDDLLFAMLSMIYSEKNAYRQKYQKVIGSSDIIVSDGDIKTLIELKVLLTKSKINEVVKNYCSQMERYNTTEVYDKNIFLIFAANLNASELKELVRKLENSENDNLINKTFIILSINHSFSGSDKSSQEIVKRTQVIQNENDVDIHVLTTEYVREALELKSRIKEVSGVNPKLVDVQSLRDRLEKDIDELNWYKKIFPNFESDKLKSLKDFKSFEKEVAQNNIETLSKQ